MSASARLTIDRLVVRAVLVPLRIPLLTSSGAVRTAPLALLDLHTEEGVTGRTYLFCYTPLVLKPVCELLANLEPLIQGGPSRRSRSTACCVRASACSARRASWAWRSPASTWRPGMRWRARRGSRSRARSARSAVEIDAYNSCGLGLIGADRVAAEAEALVAEGFNAIKMRLGYPDIETDLAVVRAVEAAVGDGVHVMSDYNQALTVPEAVRRVRALADEGLDWIEEPCLAHDYAGYAHVRAASTAPIQMGENWWGPRRHGRRASAPAHRTSACPTR